MAQDRNDKATLDLEHNNLDRAIRAVRDFQAGKATVAFTKAAVGKLAPEDLSTLSLATRVPVRELEKLRT